MRWNGRLGFLTKRALGLYSVVQEEMTDKKRPDIQAHAARVDAPPPTEIKIADNWSYNELVGSLRSQLFGLYLRDYRTRFGALLLVRKSKLYWIDSQHGERVPSFNALIDKLQTEANNTELKDIEIEEVKIIGVDLTIRTNPIK